MPSNRERPCRITKPSAEAQRNKARKKIRTGYSTEEQAGRLYPALIECDQSQGETGTRHFVAGTLAFLPGE